ncbi:hypothetical protein B566_EDAN013908 [Ephemera danica]|nr:hypothetical protein B566_EDAN013908 [Ephemera danica]
MVFRRRLNLTSRKPVSSPGYPEEVRNKVVSRLIVTVIFFPKTFGLPSLDCIKFDNNVSVKAKNATNAWKECVVVYVTDAESENHLRRNVKALCVACVVLLPPPPGDQPVGVRARSTKRPADLQLHTVSCVPARVQHRFRTRQVPGTPKRGPGDGLPLEPGKSSEAEGPSSTKSEKKECGPWNEMNTLKRHLIALKTGFMSDLTVIVQEEKFRCHSYILGMTSPKLAGMLKSNQRELPLCGVEATNFHILLEIMYTGGESNLRNDLVKTLHVRRDGNELQVYKAVAYCTALLSKHIDHHNVCSLLDEACLLNDNEFEACKKVIQKQTDQVLKSDSFLKCNVSTLELILKQEEVYNVTELEIYLAFTCWVMAQEEPRQNLESALSLIRFQAIRPTEAATYLTTFMANIQKQNSTQCFVAENSKNIPMDFRKEISKRHRTWSVERICPNKSETITLNCNDSFIYRSYQEQRATIPLRISFDEDVLLINVIAHCKRTAYSSYHSKITEYVYLEVKNENEQLISTATFSGETNTSYEYQLKIPTTSRPLC